MKKTSDKIILYIELLFKILMITVGFLQTSCLTFGKPIISYVLWPTVFLGIGIIIYRLIKIKNYYKSKKFIFLILFCVSFFISAMLFIKYGIYKNVRTLAWIIFQFGILYAYSSKIEKEEYSFHLDVILKVFLLYTFVLTAISLYQMAIGYSYFELSNNAPHLVHGFTWGRLFGAYWDPNIASVIACISIIIAMNFVKEKDNKLIKVFSSILIIMQIFYIVFSDSRTGRLCLATGITTYITLISLKHICEKDNLNKIKKSIFVILISAITLLLSIFIPSGIKSTYNYIKTESVSQKQNVVIENKEQEKKEYIEKEDEKIEKDTQKETQRETIGREYDISEDITNRRSDIWKSGFEIYSKNIIFGVSRNNILPYANEHMPETYILTNDQMDFSSMHNLFVDILVSQGTLGIILFLCFAITVFITIIKNIKTLISDKNFFMLISIIVTVCMCCMVMTEIIYVDSPISTIFWVSLSYIMYCISRKEEEKNG